DSGEVRQVVLSSEELGFQIRYLDLQDEREQEDVVWGIVHSDWMSAFDLSRGPLLRACLYQISTGKWVFTYTMHHIISDGWSMDILIRELLMYYGSRTAGVPVSLAPLRIQYKDYASWQQDQLRVGQQDVHRAYWLDQFAGDLPVLDLPYDRLRPSIKTYNGSSVSRSFNADISKGIKSLVHQQGGTLFMGLLAAVTTLLYRYTQQEDIIIGSPIAGREHVDLEDQIGFYVNTLALRMRFTGGDSYLDLLDQVKQVTLGAYEHQSYPFDELVDSLDLQRDMSRNPLFDVQVLLQDIGMGGGQNLGGLEVSGYGGGEKQTSIFDMVFSFAEVGESLHLTLTYNSDIYNNGTAAQLSAHLEQLLGAITADPSLSVSQLDYLSEREKHQLLVGFNDTFRDYDKGMTIVGLFEEQVSKSADRVALVFGETELTYGELNEHSNRLA
ncbi:condensation domain-containing protein, partial [Pedobacter jeongneungensis]|uniref:condensation domain-containing protein n=1 Tax=Pedobacter jeongneungensis TaxID=947309 RepID=UPI0031E93F07